MTASLDPQPIETLCTSDGFVLGIYESGYTTTPYSTHIIRKDECGRIRDHAGDSPDVEHGTAFLAWAPIPFSRESVVNVALPKEARYLHKEIKTIICSPSAMNNASKTLKSLQMVFLNANVNFSDQTKLTKQIIEIRPLVTNSLQNANDEVILQQMRDLFAN